MVKSKLTERKRLLLRAGEMAALGAASVILLVFLASSLDGLLLRDGQGAAVVSAVLVDLANTDRSTNKIVELKTSAELTVIAQAKADDMAEKGYFAHTSPEGRDPWYWFKQGGYLFRYAGENLAIDFSDSADVERAWMNSPAHRANILNAHFTEIGIATAVGTYEGRRTTFVVQEFGAPAHAVAGTTTEETPKELTKTAKPTEIAIATTEPKPTPSVVGKAQAAKEPSQASTSVPAATAILRANATGLAAPEPTTIERLGLQDLWNIFAASPRTTLKFAYYLFGIFILLALVIETGIEIRRHHMRHVALVALLMVLMGGLFLTADKVVFTEPHVANTASSLSL